MLLGRKPVLSTTSECKNKLSNTFIIAYFSLRNLPQITVAINKNKSVIMIKKKDNIAHNKKTNGSSKMQINKIPKKNLTEQDSLKLFKRVISKLNVVRWFCCLGTMDFQVLLHLVFCRVVWKTNSFWASGQKQQAAVYLLRKQYGAWMSSSLYLMLMK